MKNNDIIDNEKQDKKTIKGIGVLVLSLLLAVFTVVVLSV